MGHVFAIFFFSNTSLIDQDLIIIVCSKAFFIFKQDLKKTLGLFRSLRGCLFLDGLNQHWWCY